MSRVVVVGAGVGGLAAAARLAASGHDVTVCEQAPTVGGKLGLHERDGFRFDTGPSLLTLPAVFERLFATTGDPLAGVLDVVPVEPIARHVFADGTVVDTSRDLDAFCARLDDVLAPGSGDDWRRLHERGRRVWEATEVDLLGSELRGLRTMAELALRRPRDLPAVAPHRTLRGVGRAALRDSRLRQLLDRYATYSGSDPRRAPAALVAVPYAEQAFGGWYVRGGLRLLGDAIADRAVERGARLRLRADVVAVETAGGRASGVRLADGGRLPADVVVSDADAAHLLGDLLPAGRAGAGGAVARARRRLARATPSLSGFVLLLGVRGRTPGLAHHTVLFPRRYDDEFDAVFGRPARPVDDPTLYVSAPHDETAAPPGCEAWFALVNAPRHAPGPAGRGTVDWDAPGVADAYADRLLALLAARGLDVRERLVTRDVLTPADLARRTRAVGGAIYGTASHGPLATAGRPANRGPVPGLFLVGGSAHPGGGLPIVALGAEVVARAIGPA